MNYWEQGIEKTSNKRTHVANIIAAAFFWDQPYEGTFQELIGDLLVAVRTHGYEIVGEDK